MPAVQRVRVSDIHAPPPAMRAILEGTETSDFARKHPPLSAVQRVRVRFGKKCCDSRHQTNVLAHETCHFEMYGENHPESVVTSTNDGSCTSGSTSTVPMTMLVLVLAPVLVLVPVQVLVVAVGLGRHEC